MAYAYASTQPTNKVILVGHDGRSEGAQMPFRARFMASMRSWVTGRWAILPVFYRIIGVLAITLGLRELEHHQVA